MRYWLQKLMFVLMPAIFGVVTAAKDYKGAELRTFSSYLYGRLEVNYKACLLYTSPSPRDGLLSRMPSSA